MRLRLRRVPSIVSGRHVQHPPTLPVSPARLRNYSLHRGGLGGGGLLVPIYVVILGASSHDAIPLSKVGMDRRSASRPATIVGNAVASFILNYRKRHPTLPKRPLVDYETMVMMEPMTLGMLSIPLSLILATAGTIVGVHLNAVLPNWLTTLLLVLLLGNATYRSVLKAREVWMAETHKAAGRETKPGDICPLDESDVAQLVPSGSDESCVNADDSVVQALVCETKERLPAADLGMLFLTWAGLFLFSYLKGGEGAASSVGVPCGSTAFWLLLVTSIVFFMAVTCFFAARLVERHTLLRTHGYVYPKGDVAWTRRSALEFPALCSVAGVAAGCLGIGGGMVKGPILLEMGLLPQVAAATSSTMILFTASATTMQFMFLGVLPWEYAAYYGFLGLVAGLLGETILAYLVKKYQKTSLVIVVIAATIGLSTITMGTLGMTAVVKHGIQPFHSLCPSH
ncbi:hypothetical protein ACHHYP_16256 [Achlya hypogyna]|uniref:Sulfite exporter TauE/SafE n=1 Tax=Achlya hypogyna TaxID=1202772 RepID=A0A1V9ZE61_ACHHY|nr:hypothetical protein ACHHYP_16256 [Achlya hypogyna]